MECNKDEAARAKEIAEKKFVAKDIMGAKKFATKAQTLYPGLEGISHFLATLDVYAAAENKISGEADWYGILGVNPQADDESVRKQYRKLALMLHPDKNKSVGADGAFKFISEAWSFLSDKTRRLAYDQRRSGKGFQKVPASGGGSSGGGTSMPSGVNGFYNFTKPTTSNVRTQKSTSRAGQTPSPASSQKPKPPKTFWTVCHQCKMQYEYLRVYLNHNLLCPNCQEPFRAVETPPPATTGSKSSTTWSFSQQKQNSNNQRAGTNASNAGRNTSSTPNAGSGGHDSKNRTNFQWGPFSRTAGASSASQAASVVQQAYERVKREREEAQAATKREEAMRRKQHSSKRAATASTRGQPNSAKRQRVIYEFSTNGTGKNVTTQMGGGVGGAGVPNSSGSKQVNPEAVRVSGIRDLSQADVQNLLMGKARTEVCKKLSEWKSVATCEAAAKEDRKGNEGEVNKEGKLVENGNVFNQTKSGKAVDTRNSTDATKSSVGTSETKPDAEALETMSMNVPDPDFHDFDKDRTEKCFGENQVWAAYDDDDGMPRYYAMIHSVISLKPFKMRISWLNSKTNSELGPLNWVGSGFSKTCGDFRVGKYEVNNSLNSFSHKVKWTKGTRGVICIYPKKGEVWALYRNWSPHWNELTEDEVIHKYDMVEVLEDYSEEIGVTVTPLVKVAGFKTVFHRHLNPKEVKMIPKEEIFRFSHQVPSYLLTGQESPNAPKGCRELDPAATPLELLHVIAHVKDEDIVGNGEKIREQNDEYEIEKGGDKETLENCARPRNEQEDSKGNPK